jgi:hypothetical protein
MSFALRFAPVVALLALLIAAYASFERSFIGFPDSSITDYGRLARSVSALIIAISAAAAAALLWARATRRAVPAAFVMAIYAAAMICATGVLLAGGIMLDNGQGG